MSEPKQISAKVLANIRKRRPLILCLTNSVVQNITANFLLAVGAVPVMLEDESEIRDLLHTCANGLLVNVGTLSAAQAQAMRAAVQEAKSANIPWVLDPVAVGLLKYRTSVCRELLATPPALIRGNASEIIALAGAEGAICRGVESTADSAEAVAAAQALARSTGAAVLVTGPTDYATDGSATIACRNGAEIMTRVTGVGCAMGALSAACMASADTPLHAAVASAAILGIAGEKAAARHCLPGSFATALADELAALSEDDVANYAIQEIL